MTTPTTTTNTTSREASAPSALPPSPPPLPRYPTVLREGMNESFELEAQQYSPPRTSTEGVPRFPSLTDMDMGSRVASIKDVESLKAIEGGVTLEQKDTDGRRELMLDKGRMTERKEKPGMGALQKVVCQMPDPVLLFYFELLITFLIEVVAPRFLKLLPVKVIMTTMFAATIAAACVWRKTRVIPLKNGGRLLEMPNVKKIVTKGEMLRKKEAALLEREDKVRKGQIRLEAMRKEIEGRLPPTQSVEGALKNAIHAKKQEEEQKKEN